MALDHVKVDVDGGGKRVDALSVTRGADTVYREITVPIESFGDDLILANAAAATLQAVPTSQADPITGDCRVVEIVVRNRHASQARTVTIQDKQGTPVKLLDLQLLAPGETWSFRSGGVKFLGGVSWVASGDSVVGWVIARQAT